MRSPSSLVRIQINSPWIWHFLFVFSDIILHSLSHLLQQRAFHMQQGWYSGTHSRKEGKTEMPQKPEATTEKRPAFKTERAPGACCNRWLSECVLVPSSKRPTRFSTHGGTDECLVSDFWPERRDGSEDHWTAQSEQFGTQRETKL